MTKFKVNNRVSIAHISNRDFYKAMNAKGVIAVDNFAPAPWVSTPNINLPMGALNFIRPKAIEVLIAPRVADKLARPEKNGVWGDKTTTIKLKEYTGTTRPDDGLTSDGLQTKTNYDYQLRGVYYYQSDWMATDLQQTQGAAMNVDYRDDQVNGTMKALSLTRNNIFFRGVATKGQLAPIYGLLNDPLLNPYQTVATNGAETNPSTYWADKTPEQIANDVVGAVNQLYIQSNGIVEDELENGRIILAVATGSLGNLDRTNMYGKSARVMLKETYGDKLEIVSVPQFNSADSESDVFYVIFDMRDGDATIVNSYVEMARAYPVFQKDSVWSQKISAATSGAIVQYAWAIVRYNGIGKTESR